MTTREDCIPDDVYAALREEFVGADDEPWAGDALVATVFVGYYASEAIPDISDESLREYTVELAERLGYIAAIDYGAKTENLWTVVRTLLDAIEQGKLPLPHIELQPTDSEK